jgi:hypothetical protein
MSKHPVRSYSEQWTCLKTREYDLGTYYCTQPKHPGKCRKWTLGEFVEVTPSLGIRAG